MQTSTSCSNTNGRNTPEASQKRTPPEMAHTQGKRTESEQMFPRRNAVITRTGPQWPRTGRTQPKGARELVNEQMFAPHKHTPPRITIHRTNVRTPSPGAHHPEHLYPSPTLPLGTPNNTCTQQLLATTSNRGWHRPPAPRAPPWGGAPVCVYGTQIAFGRGV